MLLRRGSTWTPSIAWPRCWSTPTTPSLCVTGKASFKCGTAARKRCTAGRRQKRWGRSCTSCWKPNSPHRSMRSGRNWSAQAVGTVSWCTLGKTASTALWTAAGRCRRKPRHPSFWRSTAISPTASARKKACASFPVTYCGCRMKSGGASPASCTIPRGRNWSR